MALKHLLKTHIGTDVRLAMILLFAVITVVGVTPFAVARVFNGEWLAAGLDLVLILVMIGNAAFAWRTGNSALAGKINAVVVSLSCALLGGVLGPAGLFWAYTVILANYMLAPRLMATVCGVLIIVSGLVVAPFASTLAMAAFAVSAALVMLYAFIFASLTDVQRKMLEGLATRDALTGVANRRCMEVELAEALKGHHARGESATLAVLDLDHFKQVNDDYGHDAGDRVLMAFTERVQACIRKRDRLYRLGGEEFVLLLPDTDHSGARAALEKVRDAVQSQPLAEGLRVTTSIGAATLEAEDDWPRWLARADSALYRAKDAGRDRVSFEDGPSRPGERRLRLVSGRPRH
ncbi:GGDEF domain-containing protein [Arenimonas soli]|uniref:diguanylate cyclase n=1 Tax=Arenimonas soli TaxID=2269504 RepID=A0ABQ1HN91_9GAMM|nr:GGDEF domain-containing protein [Arenimonas soli]GGA83668.1 GGDEF domain-containing protein [Arenimonas soli]